MQCISYITFLLWIKSLLIINNDLFNNNYVGKPGASVTPSIPSYEKPQPTYQKPNAGYPGSPGKLIFFINTVLN